MKILFFEWKSFGNDDILSAFKNLKHTVVTVPFSNKEVRADAAEEAALAAQISENSPDIVFTFNYFPIISLVCKKLDIPYFSWIYDNPYVLMYSYTIANPCNYVFTFDKCSYEEFHNAGINTVHYLPLAANTKRLSSMRDFKTFNNTKWLNKAEIAFIGSLYTEKHQFFNRMKGLREYTEGYLEGIMAAQKKVYGCNFIQELLPKKIIDDLLKALPMQPDPTGVESLEYLYAQYVINRQITATERTEILTEIGKNHPFDLYTPDEKFSLPGCINHGPVDYYDFAPYVFKKAKINLNISLRSIKSGIPLRAFDILGAGGFLLTNYQPDFDDCYIAGEDYVYYESTHDLLNKINYYLKHENERRQIAENGFKRTQELHTYENRVAEMLEYLS